LERMRRIKKVSPGRGSSGGGVAFHKTGKREAQNLGGKTGRGWT